MEAYLGNIKRDKPMHSGDGPDLGLKRRIYDNAPLGESFKPFIIKPPEIAIEHNDRGYSFIKLENTDIKKLNEISFRPNWLLLGILCGNTRIDPKFGKLPSSEIYYMDRDRYERETRVITLPNRDIARLYLACGEAIGGTGIEAMIQIAERFLEYGKARNSIVPDLITELRKIKQAGPIASFIRTQEPAIVEPVKAEQPDPKEEIAHLQREITQLKTRVTIAENGEARERARAESQVRQILDLNLELFQLKEMLGRRTTSQESIQTTKAPLTAAAELFGFSIDMLRQLPIEDVRDLLRHTRNEEARRLHTDRYRDNPRLKAITDAGMKERNKALDILEKEFIPFTEE